MNVPDSYHKLLVDELYNRFEMAQLTSDKEHFADVVRCFFQVLHLPVTEPHLIELSTRLSSILVSSFEGSKTERRQALLVLSLTLESWLKKMLWLLDPKKYQEYRANTRGSSAYYEYFELLPAQGQRPSFPLQQQMQKAYQWRNREAHAAVTPLSSTELSLRIYDVWICYIYPIVKHFADLRKIVEQHQLTNLRPYLKQVQEQFQAYRKGFVLISGYELDFPIFSLTALRISGRPITEKNTIKGIQLWRNQLIEAHRKKRRKDGGNGMLIWGGAGMGKSRTLMVLALEDAVQKQAHYKNLSYPFPVFLPLRTWRNDTSLLEYIAQELQVSFSNTVKLLEKGYLRLYLDGLNEIETNDNIRGKREIEIQELLDRYPKTFVVISSRKEDGIPFKLTQVRVFQLAPMDRAQMRLFLTKNTTYQYIIDRINHDLQLGKDKAVYLSKDEQQFYRLLQVPLLFTYAIELVGRTKQLADTIDAMIQTFIAYLLDREVSIHSKREIRKRYMADLLHQYSLALIKLETIQLYNVANPQERDFIRQNIDVIQLLDPTLIDMEQRILSEQQLSKKREQLTKKEKKYIRKYAIKIKEEEVKKANVQQSNKGKKDKEVLLNVHHSLHRPKDIAHFFKLFHNSKGLKYLTHDWDKPGDPFDRNRLLIMAKKEFEENISKHTIPAYLQSVIQEFMFSEQDNQFKTHLKQGWSSPALSRWCYENKGEHPICHEAYEKDTIQVFKEAIEIRKGKLKGILEACAQKVFKEKGFTIEYDGTLSRANFHTDVAHFKSAIRYLLRTIQQHAGLNRRLSFHYERIKKDNHRIGMLQIIHHNSSIACLADIECPDDFFGGDLGDVKKYLTGLCNWSIKANFDNGPHQLFILNDDNASSKGLKLESEEINDLTHILTFYY